MDLLRIGMSYQYLVDGLLDLTNLMFFPINSSRLIIFGIVLLYLYIIGLCFFLHMFLQNQLVMFLYLFFSFLCIISLLVPYEYVSIDSIDCILLSLLALNVILPTFSVNTLCFLLSNFCYHFNSSILFFMNSLWFSFRLSTSSSLCSQWFHNLSI